jgi:hypothetical protein
MANDKYFYKDWELFKTSLLKEQPVPEENEGEKQARIKHLESHFEEWVKFYFSKYATAEPADFHIKDSKKLLNNDRIYIVRPWSREMAKDARTMFEFIYMALTGKVKSVLFLSHTETQAQNLLKPYKMAFEFNQRIISDYGEQKSALQWSDGHFITKSGCSFFAFGAGQAPRGTRDEEIRPDAIIFSDIDTDEEVRNPERVKTKWLWIEQAVMPTVSVSGNIRIVFLGNIIGKDTCITRAIKFADHYQIINIRDKNGVSRWNKNSEEQIDWLLSKMSWASSQKEYFNNPILEGSTFKNMRWDVIPPLNKFPFLIKYGDPAPSNSENKKSSHKANFLLGMLDGVLYVITGYLEQTTNANFVGWYWDLEEFTKGKCQTYNYIENNSLQDPFYQQVFLPLFEATGKEKEKHIYPTPDGRKKPDKYTRIEGNLEPLHRLGKLILNEKERNNPHMMRLEEQFEAVEPTLAANVDGVDAVEGGWWVLSNKLIVLKKESILIGAKSQNSGHRY